MATTATAVSAEPLSDADEAAEHVARRAFADSAIGPVGLELESHSVDMSMPHRRVGWRRLQEIAASLTGHSGADGLAGVITFEPGGAVELSGPPHRDALSAIASMRSDHEVLVSAFRAEGIGLTALGTDPLRIPERINPGARYGAMTRHFGAAGLGRTGLQMMTSTASLQVNVQAGRPRQWGHRLALAQNLGPTLVAIAAASPMLCGQVTGWRSTRQHIWDRLEPRRCGPIALGADPADSWARYALRAPVMLVRRTDGAANAVVTDVPFESWADGRVQLAGRRPTAADLDYHLTTLFPPVRPRGWLELRYLDASGESWWPALTFTAATVLDNPRAADVAAEAVEPVATAWAAAARDGLSDPLLRTAARRVVAAACNEAPEELRAGMAHLAENVDGGRCAGDEFTENAARYGVAQAFCAVSQ